MSSLMLKHEGISRAIGEAIKLAKPRRFKQSVELIVKLKDIDVRKPENRINTIVTLPNPPKDKLAKVAVIASGDLALRAKEAEADIVIDKDELQTIASDKKRAKKIAKAYDFFVAQADLMPLIGRLLGRYLGPRGKMPTPIPPNVDVKPFIERFRRSVRVRIKNDPQVMCRIGIEDQSPDELAENVLAVINALLKKFQPQNIEKVYVKLTMGPAVRVEKKKG